MTTTDANAGKGASEMSSANDNLSRDPSNQPTSPPALMSDEAGARDNPVDLHGPQGASTAITTMPLKQSTSSRLFKEATRSMGINLADYNDDERDIEDDDGDDDDDDDELLAMPSGSQAIELYLDASLMDIERSQSISASISAKEAMSMPPPPPGPPVRQTSASGSLKFSGNQASKPSALPTLSASSMDNMMEEEDDDDELFSAEFMKEFGSSSGFPGSSSNKSPYPRRQTLLSLTGDGGLSDGADDEGGDGTLGLNDLTISQRHTTRSGQPLGSASSTSLSSSSTTFLSPHSTMGRSPSVPRTAPVATGTTFLPALSSEMERFRAGSLTQHSHSQDLSQYEELLEMTDRQSGIAMAMATAKGTSSSSSSSSSSSLLASTTAANARTTAATMMAEVATVSAADIDDFWEDDDEEFRAMLQESYELQEQMEGRQAPPSTSSSSVRSSVSTERRKHAIVDEDAEQLMLEADRILAESAKMDARLDAAKKTRTTRGAEEAGATAGGAGSRRHEQAKSAASMGPPPHDYTLPPEKGSFIKARNSRGQTLFLPKRTRVRHEQLAADLLGQDSPMGGKTLLSMPIHRMMDELEMEIKVRDQEALYRVEFEAQELDQHMHEMDTFGRNHLRREDLWVDKYRPKNYTDLMGDEYVNREVLSWIKEWDQCVFGRKYRKTVGGGGVAGRGSGGAGGAGGQVKKPFQQEFHAKRADPLGRPDRKILLLTGPPGMGKTTMAHVIAKQAGYNIIEVNASDDRTAATIKGKIEAALEIQSIRGSDKPNLLIIDEIDGASSSGGDQSFIKLLVDIASVEAHPPNQRSGEGGLATTTRSRGRKQQHKRPLMRPIICICNDQYASVLRPLRTIAQIYQFRKPSVRAVVKRLQQICELEQLSHDTRACGMLYEMTEGDMRSCLNTLQFIKNKIKSSALDTTGESEGGGGGLTVEMLGRAAVGRKDQNKSLYSVWEELFQASYARKNRSALKVIDGERDGLLRDDSSAYVSRLVNLIHTNGEYDKLMHGCFENFLRMTFHDTAMSKVVENTDWIAFYDQLNGRVMSQFEYELLGYVGYALVNFHRYFAGSVKQQKLEYPRKDYESYLALKANESIAQAVLMNLTPTLQRQYGKSNFAAELLAPLLRILSPNMRPVNKQLIKPDERAVLKRLVEVMIQFRLTFVQEKLDDGQFVYRLEPALEKIGNFTGIGLKNVMNGRYATRQLIAQEIEVELVRRQEALKEEAEAELARKGKGKQKAGSFDPSISTMDGKGLKKGNSGDGDADKGKKDREAVDFFGRPIPRTNEDMTTAMKIDASEGGDEVGAIGDRNGAWLATRPTQHRVWYRFNEGFSNAVKAKVFMHELF
ncbi:hypothetical protein DFQ27_003895 [Actinomortierella ambigua]|uniref:AAA+ ATPase domain-containing protein n=1 Tax=Actinomortierella ambigua TaxID=1343610 RepID=A0A9P6Q634_9FUNG|nr:hypothetical protein DFQ27_003895 [Actinomortierella ambigua]